MSGAPARQRIPIGLAAHSFSYLCGFVGSGTPNGWAHPYTVDDLLDLATAHGLGGLELPLPHFPGSMEPDALDRLREAAGERGLWLVLAGAVVEQEESSQLLRAASRLGAPTVRMLVSHMLCGDRRAVRDTWGEYLREIAGRLRVLQPLAEELGINIALENHQDVTSAELLALCEELESPRIGVTLDAINPLAVVEEPLAFARRVAPYLKHVHLKDYHLHRSPRGYRLVRCALGSGVLDVPALLTLLAQEAPDATVALEIGALEARHVRFLEDDFWPGYPPRRVEEILPCLRLRETQARPEQEDWRTPWERGEHGESLAAYETRQFEDSVFYLHSLGKE